MRATGRRSFRGASVIQALNTSTAPCLVQDHVGRTKTAENKGGVCVRGATFREQKMSSCRPCHGCTAHRHALRCITRGHGENDQVLRTWKRRS